MARNWTDAERARHSAAMKAHWEKKHRAPAAQTAFNKAPRLVVAQKPQPQRVGLMARLKEVFQNLGGRQA